MIVKGDPSQILPVFAVIIGFWYTVTIDTAVDVIPHTGSEPVTTYEVVETGETTELPLLKV